MCNNFGFQAVTYLFEEKTENEQKKRKLNTKLTAVYMIITEVSLATRERTKAENERKKIIHKA